MDSLSGYKVEVTAPRAEEAVRYGGAFNNNVKFSGARCVVKFKRPVEGQFVNECCLHSRLRHPNIVQFIGVWYEQDERDLHLVLERMHASLDVSLETHPHIPLPIKLSVLRDVSAGLMYLHSFAPPIIHGDLTTTNILLTQDWRAKIADFGNSVDQSTLAIAPGARAYMPPEVFTGPLKYDTKLDIFSFGTVALYVGVQTRDADRNKRSDQLQTLRTASDGMCLYEIVIWCHCDPSRRPSSHDLNIQMEQLCSAHPLPYRDMVQLLHDKSDNLCKELENRKVVLSDQRVVELQRELEITKRSMKAENDKLKMEIGQLTEKYTALKEVIMKGNEEMVEKQKKLDKLEEENERLQSKSPRKSSSSTHEDYIMYIRTLKGQVASLEEDIARLNQVIESKNILISELQKNKADLKSINRCNKDDIHEGPRKRGLHTCVPQDGRLAEGSNDANLNGLLQKLKVTEERMMAMEESYRSALTKIEVITAERDIFADDFRKERDDRSRVAGEKGQVASELEAAQQKISEISAKLSSAIKEIDHLSAGLRQSTDELNRAKEEIAVKVAQVKQYQKQVEAYKQQLEQNNEQTQAFRQQLDHMSKLKEQAEKRLTTEAVRGSDTKKPMDLEFKPSFCSGTPIAASPFSISEEDRVTGIGTSLRAVRGNDLDTDLDTGLGNIVSPHTCLPAPVAGMQQHPLSAPPTGSDRVPSPRIFSPQPPPHAGPPSLDNLPHQSAMGGSQGIAYPTLDQHQDEHVGSGEPTAPPDPNLTCPQCRLVFKKGEIQKFRLHVQECKHSK